MVASAEFAAAICSSNPVVTNTNDSGAGSLRDAMNIACDGATVTFNIPPGDPGFSNGVYTIKLASVLTISKNLTINGPGATVLTISGEHNDRVFYVNSTFSLTLDSLTVANGAVTTIGNAGGGIYSQGTVTITNCVVTGNSVGNNFVTRGGGGVYTSGVLTIANSTISNNSLTDNGDNTYGQGSGIFIDGGNLTMTNSTVSQNSINASNGAGQGGFGAGVYVSEGAATITGSTISNNTCGGPNMAGCDGAGLNVNDSSATIVDTVISGNSAIGTGQTAGGGVETSNTGLTTFARCTISGNSVVNGSIRAGGGLQIDSAVEIVDSTISGNSASQGGGISTTNRAHLTLSNSTLSGNSAHGGNLALGGAITNNGGSISVIASTIASNSATNTSGTAGAQAGGIQNEPDASNTIVPINLTNTIIALNTADGTPGTGQATMPDLSGAFESKGHNLIGDTTGATISGDSGSNVLSQNPNLATLANNGGTTQTMRILPGSPAIDAGGDFTTLTSAIDANTTSLTVADATPFPAGVGYVIKIDNEQITVISKTANTLTVARGANPAPHNSGAAVNPAFDQRGQPRKAGGALEIGSFESNYALSITAGDSQSTSVGSAFGTAFQFTVTDNGQPAAGVPVTFTAPDSGASGTFAGGTNTAIVQTGADGVAISPVFTANTTAGSYMVAVGFGGNLTTFTYSLTNNPGPVTHFGVAAPATTTGGTVFDVTVTALDQFDNLVPSYNGTVHFTSTDPQAVLPPDSGLTSGAATLNMVLKTGGNQTVTATDIASSTITGTSSAIKVAVTTPLNISTRMEVLSGENVLIAGFIVAGEPNTTKKVMIRGLGPSLVNQGVAADLVLSDPLLEVHGPAGFTTITNDNWQDASNTSEIPDGFQPGDSRESVIIAVLPIDSNGIGKYTAILSGAHGEQGIGLVEAYDLEAGTGQFANISTRGFIDTGANVMIGGFILSGSNAGAKVLIRAIGPSLVDQGVAGALADPTLEIHDKDGNKIRSNDNWKIDDATGQSQQTAIEGTTIPPTNDLESAVLDTFAPGAYTAIVAGKGGVTGVGLVEVYNLKQ